MKDGIYKLPLTGGCFCKSIRYEITGEILNAGICHCRSCQLSTGSGNYPFLVINEESIKITGDLKEYTRTGSSGNKVHAGFCANCGTTICGRPELWRRIRTISAATLDNPEVYVPLMNVWLEDTQPWVAIKSGINNFERNPVK